MEAPSSHWCLLLLCANVCLAQENEYVIGTALQQNPESYERLPACALPFHAFHDGACWCRLSQPAEPVCLLQPASEAFKHLMHESMRALRAWIHATNA